MLAMTTLVSSAEYAEKDDDIDASSAVSNMEPNPVGGEEENSDNSGGSLSIGNNSFGFNFDSDEVNKIGNGALISSGSSVTEAKLRLLTTPQGGRKSVITIDDGKRKNVARFLGSFPPASEPVPPASGGIYRHEASAVSSLTSELGSLSESARSDRNLTKPEVDIRASGSSTAWGVTSSSTMKRPLEEHVADNQSSKFFCREKFETLRAHQFPNDDAEGKADEGTGDGQQVPPAPSSASSTVGSSNHKSVPLAKRKERNAREKDRSFRIAQQIDELRMVLSSGGVVVPKGTKSHVLTEAAKYIQMLQQKQSQSEMERQHLIQQLLKIGSGALGPDAALAIRQAAQQHGIFHLGQFDQLPPSSCSDPRNSSSSCLPTAAPQELRKESFIEDEDYRQLFDLASIPLAIASMGGVFTDCNRMFSTVSQYGKKDLCSMTIFNLIARSDLQNAFNQMSTMVSPQENVKSQKHGYHARILLRGTMKSNHEMGISITLIRGQSRIPKCFLVALLKESYYGASEQPSIFSTLDYTQ